ncbi:Mechanosensitive ion channel [Tindallia magadiensis]|uniref:Mechanosensitive ion channel n=1 Tax=Tindallia magadiensis TaxID=69895 RepID=A0A1I3HTL5_9FIRM|nr:mechanosensitive ion channel domain-containing protein [Tindallia magadiensis]SFI39074.1 Mechanosensitive ion channel [Tindallia magadiensis]
MEDGSVAVFEWLYILIGLASIIAARFIMGKVMRRFIQKGRDAWLSVLNWITVYLLITYAATYFSEASWLFGPLFTFGNTSVSLFTTMVAVFILIFAARISSLLKGAILPQVFEKYQMDASARFTFASLIHYMILAVAVIFSLSTLGIDISSLTVFAGVIGIGIGFGMQNIASNFISGIIILFERPIKVGDRVIIDNIIGDVEEIKMRATVVRTLENERIIIPNSFFLEEKVVNRSYADSNLRIFIDVGVSYGSDVNRVKEVLEEAAAELKSKTSEMLDEPPLIRFRDFGDSSLDFRLLVSINNPEKEFAIKSDLRFLILKKFRQNNIVIPFPQRDLHLFQQEKEKSSDT